MSDDTVFESVAVEVTLIAIERIVGRGNLECLATVEPSIAGVILRVQGIQLLRDRITGQRTIQPPQFRGGDGRWWPGIVLPRNVLMAVADACDEDADPRNH